MTKRLVVIDGKSIFYRGYYAMPNLSLPDGTPTGGVYGFASLALELIKKLEPDYVAVAWDKRGTNIRKRRELYPEYKAGRKPAPDDFYTQIPILYELLDAFGWPLYEIDDYEADDIMGAFAKQASEKGIETCLITSDLDVLQLISPMTKVYALKKGLSNIEEFDVDYFQNKYGIDVHQFLDLKALKGDSSDNIPGVAGVGEKTGLELLKQYQNLDNIYAHIDEIKPSVAKKLIAGKDMAYLSQKVATIWDDAPVKLDWNVADVNDTDLTKVAEILHRLEFNSLISRMPKHMRFEADYKVSTLQEVAAPLVVALGEETLLALIENRLYLSTDRKTYYEIGVDRFDISLCSAFGFTKLISFDIKSLYHFLNKSGVGLDISSLHDILQAAFLINPLMRDHDQNSILGIDDEATIGQRLGAMCDAYKRQQKFFKDNEKLADIAHNFDFPLIELLYKMEKRGIKIDKKILDDMGKKLNQELQSIEREMHDMAGYKFNIASPNQLSEVLFTKLQLSTTGIKKGKTGYSTSQKELDKLRGAHPIIELIERSRELAKLKNTYVDVLPGLADENNRIHTTFNQDVTSTGRLSSTNPNLQNIPIRTAQGREVRRAFVADEGKVFINADYSQFELRLAAFLAGDQEMIDDFNNGIDIHAKTASEIYGVPLEEVTKNQRRNAKVINFGVLYGMSPHGLSAATNMSVVEAKRFIDEYFAIRKPIRHFIDKTIDMARNQGYVETYFGRRRPTPDVKSENFMVRSSAERAAANMPIQGTEADLMKLAMLKVEQVIEGLGEQILQIHDSILIETPKENAQKVADLLKETMENIAPQIKIHLKVDVAMGDNWGEV